jgi:hypothetical protein
MIGCYKQDVSDEGRYSESVIVRVTLLLSGMMMMNGSYLSNSFFVLLSLFSSFDRFHIHSLAYVFGLSDAIRGF